MSLRTVGVAEAEAHFGRIAAAVNAIGEPVVVIRDGRPWVEIRPLAASDETPGSLLPAETREAIGQALEMLADRRHERFSTVEELFEDLGI